MSEPVTKVLPRMSLSQFPTPGLIWNVCAESAERCLATICGLCLGIVESFSLFSQGRA